MTSLLPNTRRPDITINISGRIDITSRIVRLLDMQPGDVIDICQADSEYYLYIRHKGVDLVGRHQGQCFPTSRGGRGSFRTWSVRLAKALRKVTACEDLIVRFYCGDPQIINGKILIPVIIRNVLSRC